MRKKIFLIYIFSILLISSIDAYLFFDWLLENILTILLLFFIFLTKIPFSKSSYCLVAFFITLHITGSHYGYEVPAFFDFIKDIDFSRNHYDRLVHFCFGFCFALPLFEIFSKKIQASFFFQATIISFFLLGFGALYEILEWLTVIIVVPELGSLFLGTQGDIWDAQKDMLLGFLGTILMMCFIHLYQNMTSQKAR